MPNKFCRGTLYRISGKSYCVGEKKTKSKKRTRTYLKKPKTIRKTRKYRKTEKNRAKGPGVNDPKCCMCGKVINNEHSLILMPSECKIKYGSRAHRICEECWFDEEKGFALEGRSHKCPGCEKKLPLTYVKQKTPEMIDLTIDSD
jgi:hypothetical protein